jgi:hypothetical protein
MKIHLLTPAERNPHSWEEFPKIFLSGIQEGQETTVGPGDSGFYPDFWVVWKRKCLFLQVATVNSDVSHMHSS